MTSTRSNVTTSTATYPLQSALELLHSPQALISLNPLVVSSSLVSETTTTSTYSITDALLLLGFLRTTTTYEATFTPRPYGVDVEALAAMGVITRSRWRVNEDGRIVEEGEVEAPWWLMWYVVGQWQASHAVLVARLEERLLAGQVGGGSA